jgi:hypothetical protein
MDKPTSGLAAYALRSAPVASDLRYKMAIKALKRHGRSLDFDAINRAALANLPALLGCWLPGGKYRGAEYSVRNPKRADRKPEGYAI